MPMRAFRGSRCLREPALKPCSLSQTWYLDVPHGVHKQSCWLRACERSASVPESAVCNKRGSRRASRRCNRIASPALPKDARGPAAARGDPYAHHFIFRRPRLQTTTWVDLLVKAEARAAAAAAASAAAETAAGAGAGAAVAAAAGATTRCFFGVKNEL